MAMSFPHEIIILLWFLLTQPSLHLKPTTKHPVPITFPFAILIEWEPSYRAQYSFPICSFSSFFWERLGQHSSLEQSLLSDFLWNRFSVLKPDHTAPGFRSVLEVSLWGTPAGFLGCPDGVEGGGANFCLCCFQPTLPRLRLRKGSPRHLNHNEGKKSIKWWFWVKQTASKTAVKPNISSRTYSAHISWLSARLYRQRQGKYSLYAQSNQSRKTQSSVIGAEVTLAVWKFLVATLK